MSTWQTLSDQSYSVSSLLQSGVPDKAEWALDRLFHGLGQATTSLDPSFLVKFWRICLGIKGIEGRFHGRECLAGFYDCLSDAIGEHYSPAHPLAALVSSLKKVPAEELMNTIRLGYWMTIRAFERIIGDENSMVLYMWAIYYRYWDEHRNPDGFLWKFLYLRFRYDFEDNYNPETAIALSYHHAYAAYYVCNQVELGRMITMHLFQNARVEVARMATRGNVCWSLVTEAFSFSAKAVAKFHYRRNELNWSQWAMDTAIALLQMGDEDCRIHAASLSKTLVGWLRISPHTAFDATQEKIRLGRILREIPGTGCKRCKAPFRTCQRCLLRYRNN